MIKQNELDVTIEAMNSIQAVAFEQSGSWVLRLDPRINRQDWNINVKLEKPGFPRVQMQLTFVKQKQSPPV